MSDENGELGDEDGQIGGWADVPIHRADSVGGRDVPGEPKQTERENAADQWGRVWKIYTM